MPRRKNLRALPCEQTDDEAAKSRPQEYRQGEPVQQCLAERHAAHDRDAGGSPGKAYAARNGKIAGGDLGHVQGSDPERSWLKQVGNEIAHQRSHSDGSKAGGGVAADDQLECIECAGDRGTERAGNGAGGAAADEGAQIAAPQAKGAADPGGYAASQLGIAGFQADRGAHSARPDRLQRDIDAAYERHAPAGLVGSGPAPVCGPLRCKVRASCASSRASGEEEGCLLSGSANPGHASCIPPPDCRKCGYAVLGHQLGASKLVPTCRAELVIAPLRNHVVVPQQHAIERFCRGNQLRSIPGQYEAVDEGVDRGVLDADGVARAGSVRSMGAPVATLLGAWRKRIR